MAGAILNPGRVLILCPMGTLIMADSCNMWAVNDFHFDQRVNFHRSKLCEADRHQRSMRKSSRTAKRIFILFQNGTRGSGKSEIMAAMNCGLKITPDSKRENLSGECDTPLPSDILLKPNQRNVTHEK